MRQRMRVALVVGLCYGAGYAHGTERWWEFGLLALFAVLLVVRVLVGEREAKSDG